MGTWRDWNLLGWKAPFCGTVQVARKGRGYVGREARRFEENDTNTNTASEAVQCELITTKHDHSRSAANEARKTFGMFNALRFY